MTKKVKHSIYDLAKGISPEEIAVDRRQNELRMKLGLNYNWEDRNYNKYVKEFLKISTHYKSINDYELDKAKASILITENKPIPADLYNRLLQTKEELEKANILYKI